MKTRAAAIVVGMSVATLCMSGFCIVSPASLVAQQAGSSVNLSTGKQLLVPAPGDPRRVNSLPETLAVSPDGQWVASLNSGYGTWESQYGQSIALLSTATGKVQDVPDPRVAEKSQQVYFSGLTFSADGTKLYASLASTTDPTGEKGKGSTGNGVVVYGFADGVLKPQGFFKLPLVKLATGKRTEERKDLDPTMGIPYPAAIALVPGTSEKLLVAENLSDSVALLDAKSGAIEKLFDLSESDAVPSTYPIALAVTKDGKRAFVALWNASEVVELDLASGKVIRRVGLLKPSSPIAAGSHPCALLLDEQDGVLYVALSNRDAVAAVRIGKASAPELEAKGYFDTRLPGQSYFGAEPNALAMNADGSRLYVANMGSDAVAVLDPHRLRSMAKARSMVEPAGFVATELMPVALVSSGGKLYVASAKGKGTGPNNSPQRLPTKGPKRTFTYNPTLLYGSIAVLNEAGLEPDLRASTDEVLESNRMKAAKEEIQFAAGGERIHHVIYIIKENRTYDQIFGDLEKDGKPVANGDPSLTMYGEHITPNQHQLVLQFGVLDNFFDSAEVSGDGHVWSTAAIGTDYLEKTWQSNYSRGQRTYDYEGVVANGYPLLQKIPDVEEPYSRYIWSNMVAHGKSIYHFAEYISSSFCNDKGRSAREVNPQEGAMSGEEVACPTSTIRPGEDLPMEWGGGKNLWPWPIPRLAGNIPTKPELVGHFAKESPDFNLRVPDQIRVNVFLRHLAKWKEDREKGNDTMPNYVLLRLPNDHTSGTTVGGPTPQSLVADNDLAIGRAIDAISHSAYWDDTAFFILEDDAQNGADHVDAHRSLGIVVSKYAPHPKDGEAAVVDNRFYSTVSVLRTMEALLGVPPMNNNDAFASLISTLFTGPGDQPAFNADYSNQKNGLIYAANKKNTPGSEASAKMDFTHADRADSDKLNLILWQDAMGPKPPPAMLLVKHKKAKDDDDD